MKKTRMLLVGMATLLSTVFTYAQNADSIINKHIAAIGGKDKLASISSMYMETNSEVMGNDNAAKITIVNGKGYKMETEFNGQPIVQCITDKGGWAINPMGGSSDPQALSDDQYTMMKDHLNVGGPFSGYPGNGNKAEYLGMEKAGDVNAYKIKITEPDSLSFIDYIDPNTYYVLKTVMDMGGQQTSISFSDYKKTDFGYIMPYSLETTLPQGFTITSTVTKVAFNQPVDPKIFDMPK